MLKRFWLALRSRLRDLAIPREIFCFSDIRESKNTAICCSLGLSSLAFLWSILLGGKFDLHISEVGYIVLGASSTLLCWVIIYSLIMQLSVGRPYRRHPRRFELLELARMIVKLNEQIELLKRRGAKQSEIFPLEKAKDQLLGQFVDIWKDCDSLPNRLMRDVDSEQILRDSVCLGQRIQRETDSIARAASGRDDTAELDIASENCIKIV